MTEPLTPAGLDLRDFDWMPLEVMRLRDSDLSVLASGDAFRAAVLLWCAAWHQVPAGSLPSDDRLLANLAGYGRDLEGWVHVKDDAMRGFIECSDGRMYHPVVCEKALEADEQRNKQRKRTEAATSARRNGQRDDDRNDKRNEDHLTLPNPTLPESKKRSAAPQPSSSSDNFENLKKVYPRRKGNYGWKAAERKFNSLVKTGVDPKIIIAAAIRLGDELRSRVGTEFIPMPASWLNSEDFVESAVTSFSADDGLIEVLGEEELAAWDAHARAEGKKSYPRNSRGGWRFPSRWPPGYVPSSSHVEAAPALRRMNS
jgi:hypothetical protein